MSNSKDDEPPSKCPRLYKTSEDGEPLPKCPRIDTAMEDVPGQIPPISLISGEKNTFVSSVDSSSSAETSISPSAHTQKATTETPPKIISATKSLQVDTVKLGAKELSPKLGAKELSPKLEIEGSSVKIEPLKVIKKTTSSIKRTELNLLNVETGKTSDKKLSPKLGTKVSSVKSVPLKAVVKKSSPQKGTTVKALQVKSQKGVRKPEENVKKPAIKKTISVSKINADGKKILTPKRKLDNEVSKLVSNIEPTNKVNDDDSILPSTSLDIPGLETDTKSIETLLTSSEIIPPPPLMETELPPPPPPFPSGTLEQSHFWQHEPTPISGEIDYLKTTKMSKTVPTARASGGSDFLTSSLSNFQLIDEIHTEDDIHSHRRGDYDGDSDEFSTDDSDVPEEEIDALLEEGLPDDMKGTRKPRRRDAPITNSSDNDNDYVEIEKPMLIEKGKNPFDILPEGWILVVHGSGMPVYLHKESRVCTMSRPYFIGSGSCRKHNIPVSAIPCFQYARAIREEDEATTDKSNGVESSTNGLTQESEQSPDSIPQQADTTSIKDDQPKESSALGSVSQEPSPTITLPQSSTFIVPQSPSSTDQSNKCPFVGKTQLNGPLGALLSEAEPAQIPVQAAPRGLKVETAINDLKKQTLDVSQLHEYCTQLFQFKKVRALRFKSWVERRMHRRNLRQKARHNLPDGTKLIYFKKEVPDDKNDPSSKTVKEWILNPQGKSHICIVHEYIQHTLKTQPKYIFKEIENAATPYSATICINDIQYGTGYGSSKKTAKLEAAKKSMEVLLPELGQKLKDTKLTQDDDLVFFDEIKIEDTRVPELCNKMSELSPYSILLNCLQRNFGLSGAYIKSDLITQRNQKNVFKMLVGKHTVTVPCKNKKDGKQYACQAILQKLHPHISSWGSLVRLYGTNSMHTMRKKKTEEQEITLLQSNATINQPNTSIINKLKEEMLKLHEIRKSVRPLGLIDLDVSLPTASGVDLNNVDL